MNPTTVIVAVDKATMDALMQEVSATPVIEGDGSVPVWVWFESWAPTNDVTYNIGGDGRCAIAHRWTPLVREWWESYTAGWAGVEIRDDLPADWQYPEPTP